MQNVWEGRYEAVRGTGLRQVIEAGDASLADRLTAQLEDSLALAEAIQPPFDREIASDNPEGRARVQALADALFDQTQLLEEAFELYGLTRIPNPE
jgi:putative iron-regulated protein